MTNTKRVAHVSSGAPLVGRCCTCHAKNDGMMFLLSFDDNSTALYCGNCSPKLTDVLEYPTILPSKRTQNTKAWKCAVRMMQRGRLTPEQMNRGLFGPSLTMGDISRAVQDREAAIRKYVREAYVVRKLNDQQETIHSWFVDAPGHIEALAAYRAAGFDPGKFYSTRPVCPICRRDRVYSKASQHLICFLPDATERFAPALTGEPKFVEGQ